MAAKVVSALDLDLVTCLEASGVMSSRWNAFSPLLCSDQPERG
jgi:hypothetical protein